MPGQRAVLEGVLDPVRTKQPEERYQTAGEVRHAYARFGQEVLPLIQG